MGDLDYDAGGDSGQGERPSVKALLAAFREASRHRGRKASEKDPEEPRPSDRFGPGPEGDPPEENTPEERTPEPRLEPGSETEAGTARSPVEMLEETMAAFRKAERQAEKQARTEQQVPTEEQARSEKHGRAEAARRRGRTEPPEETSSSEEDSEEELFPAGEPSSKEKPSGEGPSGEEFSGEDSGGREAPGETVEAEEKDEEIEEAEESVSSDDLAPEFRRVLSERGSPEPSGSQEGGSGEEVPPSSGASGSEERQTSVRSFREGAEAPVSSPAGPETSFLWVTDQAAGQQPDGPSVPVGDLSALRVLEAEAFLLRGEGEGPYQRLRRIRGHPDVNVYLKPVFWRRAPGQKSPVAAHVDGTWAEGDREAFGALREKTATINQRISTLMETEGVEEGGVELRLLRFIATRAQEFVPRRIEGSSAGFVYPKLSPLLDQEAQTGRGELAQILSMTAHRIRKKQ